MSVALAELEPNFYRPVDEIPRAAEARQQIRYEAEAIISSRREQILDGKHEGIPLAVDALSTAQKAIEAREKYGKYSKEYLDKKEGLFLDCHRLVAEWRRKLRAEYFKKVRHTHDPDSGEYFSHGMSIWKMTEDALVPSKEPEEDARRVNERVEEATPRILKNLGSIALGQAVMRTVSECTDWSIKAYKNKSKKGFGGYVPEIEKVMIRDMVFDDKTDDRFEEQVGLPGIYITHDIIVEALQRRGVNAKDVNKTELHGMQLLATDDLIDFVELLDTVAGEQWCVNIFMGELVEAGHAKDYAGIREAAIRRQEELRGRAKTVALFVMDLAQQGTNRQKAPGLVEEFVKKILIDMSDRDNSLATEMFDEKTAQGLREVAHLRSLGHEEEALKLLNKVEAEAPGGGYCGAGSCGLERVLSGSEEAQEAGELGLDASEGLLKDTERACGKCKKKGGVIYDMKGKKGCTSCKATANY